MPRTTGSKSDGAGKTLLTCSATHALHDGFSDVPYVLLPVLAQSFGLTYAQVGLIRAAQAAAFAVFQLPAGMLAERLGERNLLALGTAIAGIAFLGLGAASEFFFLLMLLFLAGLGGAFQHPLCSSIVSRAYAAGGRRQALGAYNFAGDVGKLAFAGLTGLALAGGFAWQGPVVLFGALAVLAAGLIPVLLRRWNAGGRPPPSDRRRPGPAMGSWGIRNRPAFAALCGIDVIDSGTRSAFLTFIAFFLIDRGVPENLAAFAVPAVFVGGMIGKLACGYVAERIGVVRTVVLTELVTGAGIFAALALPGTVTLILLPAIGIALNGTSTVLYGTIGDLVDSNRQARAFGLFYTLGSICGVAAPFGYGLLADLMGTSATIAVMGGVVLLSVPLCRALPRDLGSGPRQEIA